MTTRKFASAESAEAAELIRLVTARQDDLFDPLPPLSEAELLADSGARGRAEEACARVALEGDRLVGYGAVDWSPDLRRAQLIGPLVHPSHRRKGLGTRLLADLSDQARRAHQKYLRAMVGSLNSAGRAFLEQAGFKQQERHTCLRIGRPDRRAEITLDGVELRRAFYDDAEEVFRFTQRLVPRTAKQVRSLLKTDSYSIVMAWKEGKPVGYVEVDLRRGDRATLEHLDGQPSLIHKGLGSVLLAEAIRIAFDREGVGSLDLLVSGADEERLQDYRRSGFHLRHELIAFEAKI